VQRARLRAGPLALHTPREDVYPGMPATAAEARGPEPGPTAVRTTAPRARRHARGVSPSSSPPTGALRIDYADGSGNRYTLDAGDDGAVEVAYDLLTPATSSTGLYSGGPPRRARVARDDPRLAELWARLADARPATSTARLKGTGAFSRRWR
jgi:hypothetical protein